MNRGVVPQRPFTFGVILLDPHPVADILLSTSDWNVQPFVIEGDH
jgi:hypothetical protein